MGLLRLGLLALPPVVYFSYGLEGLAVLLLLTVLVPLVLLVTILRLGEGGFGLLSSTRAMLFGKAKNGAPDAHGHVHEDGDHGHSHDHDEHGHSHEHDEPEHEDHAHSSLFGDHGHSHTWEKLFVSKNSPPQKIPRSTFRKIVMKLHAYVYGRWTDRYLWFVIKVIAPLLSEKGRLELAETYHGKVLRHEDAREMILNEKPIPLQDLSEQVIPYSMARNIVLSGNNKDIAVLDCPCRKFRQNPCKPIDVCLLIGDNHDWLLEHRPNDARRITKDEALKILRSEHRRGHVHTAYFKDCMGDRFFALCNCCKCCCGGIEMMVKHKCPAVTSSGYVAVVDIAKCQNCNTCELTCPFSAITMKDGHSVVDVAKCMGCGACTARCPNKAITLVRDESKPKPLDIRALAMDW